LHGKIITITNFIFSYYCYNVNNNYYIYSIKNICSWHQNYFKLNYGNRNHSFFLVWARMLWVGLIKFIKHFLFKNYSIKITALKFLFSNIFRNLFGRSGILYSPIFQFAIIWLSTFIIWILRFCYFFFNDTLCQVVVLSHSHNDSINRDCDQLEARKHISGAPWQCNRTCHYWQHRFCPSLLSNNSLLSLATSRAEH